MGSSISQFGNQLHDNNDLSTMLQQAMSNPALRQVANQMANQVRGDSSQSRQTTPGVPGTQMSNEESRREQERVAEAIRSASEKDPKDKRNEEEDEDID